MTTTISERVEELTRSGVPFVQATVVRAQEPSSARAGDRAIVLAVGCMEGFVGVVCSRTRGEALLAELDLTAEQHARVHLHVGLDIGARTAPEIALSILAEIVRQIRVEGLGASPVRERLLPPVQAIDPVCGMTVTVRRDTVHAVVAGQDHWFCMPGCRDRFLADHAADHPS
jgi:xanthine dehydrogenase accessory factor